MSVHAVQSRRNRPCLNSEGGNLLISYFVTVHPSRSDGGLLRRGGASDRSSARKIFNVFALCEHAHSASNQRGHERSNCGHDVFATSAIEGHYLEESRPAQEIIGVCNPAFEHTVVIIHGDLPPEEIYVAMRRNAAGQLRDE